MIFQEQFEELKHTGQLPSPSGVGMRILVLTQQEDCSMDELVQAIQIDPALTGRIIKLATSVQLASHVRIGTVKEAAVRLGLRTVSNVALGFTLISGNRAGRCAAFDYGGYWSWSLANAVAAQVLSRELGIGIPAEAFTCALLVRIGRLALASVHPTDYADVLEKVERDADVDLIEVEYEFFNINHREVAAAMLLDWGLPRSYSETALLFGAEHHEYDIEEAQTFEFLRLLGAASQIADLCLDDPEKQPAHWSGMKSICADLDIKSTDFARIFDQIAEQWREWGEILRVPTGDVLDFDELQRKAQEARVAAVKLASGGTGLRILAVDDDPVSLRVLVGLLRAAGHLVMTATNGRRALAMTLEWNPQIVITDWNMPEMTGLQLCKALRKMPIGRILYVLILTGQDEEDRVVEAFEAGADDYVTKPFKPKILLARIRGGQRVVNLQDRVERDKKTQKEQVSKLAVLNRKLKAAAMTDSLTELPNRRYAMKRLEMEWANSARSGQSFCVIMVDVDCFKVVNDTYGHDVGDRVLQETARAIHRTLRRGDVCARIGGEEFLVICPHMDRAGAVNAAERIREAIEQNTIVMPGYQGNVTASLGIGCRGPALESIDALLKVSDEAVYEAKRRGRNCVVFGQQGGNQRESA